MFRPTPLVEYSTVPNDGHIRDVGSTQFELPELAIPVQRWVTANLDPSCLHEKGVEQRSHVTILYGIVNDDSAPLRKIAANFGRAAVLRIGPLQMFDAPDFDVLFASVLSADAMQLHQAISEQVEVQKTHNNYVPHMTVAYLKKGEANKFVGKNPFRGTYQRPGFTFSKKDFTEEFIPLLWSSSALQESSRRTYKRVTRKVYRDRQYNVPGAKNEKEKAIDEFLKELVKSFDFSFTFSGDTGLSRLAADDLYNEALMLTQLRQKLYDIGDIPREQQFTVEDLRDRWAKLFLYWDRSNIAFMNKLRSLVK